MACRPSHRDTLDPNLTCVKSAIQDGTRVTTATVISCLRSSDADDQHQGLRSRSGEAAIHPVVLTFPGMGRSRSDCWPAMASACLAEPPPGSGLKPVMGEPAADPRPHDRDLPRRPRLLAAPYRTRGPVLLPIPHHSDGRCARTRCHSGSSPTATRTSRSGLDPVIEAFFNRGLMLLDFDEHMSTGGSCRRRSPHPAGRLHRADRHGRIQGDRQRLGRERPAVPALSGDEGAHPRHRLDGVHGPRTGTNRELVTKVNNAFTTTTRAGNAISAPACRRSPGGAASRPGDARGLLRRRVTSAGAEGSDMLSVLCQAEDEDGSKFSDKDIVAHMIFLMMAAHERRRRPTRPCPTTWRPTRNGRSAAVTSRTGSATDRSTSKRWRSWRPRPGDQRVDPFGHASAVGDDPGRARHRTLGYSIPEAPT